MIFLLARSSHRADGAPEASVRDAEEGGADRGEREELRPDDIQARGPIEDALPQNHEVRGGRTPSSDDTGSNNPEKLTAGTSVSIAVPNSAAIWLRTKTESSRPMAVEAMT